MLQSIAKAYGSADLAETSSVERRKIAEAADRGEHAIDCFEVTNE